MLLNVMHVGPQRGVLTLCYQYQTTLRYTLVVPALHNAGKQPPNTHNTVTPYRGHVAANICVDETCVMQTTYAGVCKRRSQTHRRGVR